MSDFQLSEDNATPQPPAPADSPPPEPKATAKFEFLSDAPTPIIPESPAAPQPPATARVVPNPPLPNRPTAPSNSQPNAPASRLAPIVVPNPPLPNSVVPNPVVPNPPLPNPVVPSGVIPNPPLPGAVKPSDPPAAMPAAAPNPVVPNPVVPNPVVPNPVVPNPVVPNPVMPTAATPPTAPTAGPAPLKPRPSAVPIPTPQIPTIPSPTVGKPAPAASLDDLPTAGGAPQDNFSLKIWSMGQSIKSVLDQMDGLASWLLRISLVIGTTALAYILAATLFGHAGHLEGNPNALSLVKNLKIATQAFSGALLVSAVASLVLGYEDNRLGFIAIGVGLLLNIGAPLALHTVVGLSTATAPMVPLLRQTGYFLVMIGLVKALCDSAILLWNMPGKMKSRYASVGVSNQAEAKQRIIAREANMTSPCWKLPFCRESIRKQCPAFLAKTTCWKFGRGCYCDEEMISRIVRGEALDAIKAPTRQSRQGKAPCERCYIYLEHQTYKFRMISPLALPVTILTSWLMWPIYSRVFSVADGAFNGIWNSLSFNTAKLTPDAVKTSQESLDAVAKMGNDTAEFAHYAQNMFGVLLGFLLLVYLSKAIEWAIFKAKW